MTDREEAIRDLRWLIEEYQEEKSILKAMIKNWEKDDDSGSDPGLQYEQEEIADRKWNELVKFANKLK